MNDYEKYLLSEICQFLKETGMSESKFGLAVANNNKVVSRLRAGHSVTTKTINSINKFINKTRKSI